MARRPLTGVLLVGGASTRFGSPKALAQIDGETFAERGRRILADACDEVLVVGKRGDDLPFDVVDDGTDVRAPIAGVVAGLRAAAEWSRSLVPVDCPWMTRPPSRARRRVQDGRAGEGALPGAWANPALPLLEERLAKGPLALYRAYDELAVVTVELDLAVVADVDTPGDLTARG